MRRDDPLRPPSDPGRRRAAPDWACATSQRPARPIEDIRLARMVVLPMQPRCGKRSIQRSVPTAPLRCGTPRATAATLERLTRLGELLGAPQEVARALGYDEEAFAAFVEDNPKARAAYHEARARGLESLRRAQFKLAQSNATMAIFLGKTYLDQGERREPEQSGADDLSQAKERVRAKIAALIDERRAEEARDRG